MKKKITKVVKMELPGGNAHPGPKLASAGVNMAKFCTDFNAKTADRKGTTVPVIITAYEDKSYDFVIKTTPAAELILKAAGLSKAASNAKQIVGTITDAQLTEIASYKLSENDAIAEAMLSAKRVKTYIDKEYWVTLPDGTLVSPPLEDLAPFLPREELKKSFWAA